MPEPLPIPDGGSMPPPTFSELVGRYTCDPDAPPPTEIVCLSDAMRAGDDPWRIVSYLSGLGIFVRELDDLLRINEDDTEEELHAWRCREGVAISVASDGAWVLFVP